MILKKLLNVKCVFLFSLNLLSETFLILRRTEQDNIKKNKFVSLHIRYSFFCNILIKLECSRPILENYSGIKFHEKPFSENHVVPFGQKDGLNTDRHDKASSRFSQNFTNACKTTKRYNISIHMLTPLTVLSVSCLNIKQTDDCF